MARSYGVSVPQLCIRYCLDLGMLPLPKTANPTHMRENAKLDFSISAEDLETLKGLAPIDDYGDASRFPVFSGRLQDGARQLAVVAVGGGVAAKSRQART